MTTISTSRPLGSLALLVVIILVSIVPLCQAEEYQCRNVTRDKRKDTLEIETVLNKNEAALILLLGFGGLSSILAIIYIYIRRHIFDDVHNLDSTFDAGGNVSASLTAVTIASQLLWPGDLMQSVTVAVKFGIAGVFWYCGCVLINLSLFPLLSFKFKTKAPGAKTYLQIILARCGRPAHIVFCAFALLVNLLILASIVVGGIAVLQITIKDASPEYCVLLLATLCGSYSLIGGLGSTFYVSYFNALTTFVVLSVLVINIFYLDNLPFGSMEEIYAKVNCLPGLQGNRDGSYFTFLSEGAMIWAVQGVFLVTSITYCDQASWQSRIAAKPLQGAIGFLLAGVIWFSCPATIGTVAGITYLAYSSDDPSKVLSDDQVNAGIVAAFMSQEALGKQGGIMMLTMLTMLTMSTGSGEIMGVSSIIVYDIYQTYIRPFRPKLPQGFCVFCGLRKMDQEHIASSKAQSSSLSSEKWDGHDPEAVCECPSAFMCEYCKTDIDNVHHISRAPGKLVQYRCPHHGDFRNYQESLIGFKSWCLLWVTLAFIPYGLLLHATGIDLNWIVMVGTIFTGPCFPGVILSILWSKLTGPGLIAGSLLGLVTGVVANLLMAYIYYGGEGGFLQSTVQQYAVVCGSCIGMMVSLVVTVLVSLCTTKIRSPEDEAREWQAVRDIDNPLHPWSQQYVHEFPEVKDGVTRPTYEQLEEVSRQGRIVSIIGSILFFVIFIIIIPSVMASLEVLSASEFRVWTTLINIWCLIMAIVIVVITPIEEVKAIILQIRENKAEKPKPNNNSGAYRDFTLDGDSGVDNGAFSDEVIFSSSSNGSLPRHRTGHDNINHEKCVTRL